MLRLLKIFASMITITIQRELAHRVNLGFQALLATARVAAGLAALTMLYSYVSSLAGWSAAQAIILLGAFEIVSGLLEAFIQPNLIWFAAKIQNGQLDDLLLQPAPSLFTVSFSTCQPWALIQVMLGSIVTGIGITNLGAALTPGGVLASLLLLLAGIIVTWASRLVLASLAFWAPGLELSVLYTGFWQLGRYPISVYPNAIRWALTYLVPAAFVATFPAYALTHGIDPWLLLGGAAAACAALTAACLIWRAGLRRYTSATS